ncbi:rhodanese-like domain-containing protein [Pseudomonas typographi]|uniref:Sulfurtransferase n=1 Tax=Pseudomonas typographi TaxID=2715964 RepID=A0ABR7Z290_9PSED|nr:rhodanese-like domain-containing protein [Pseudomonas typographi]MBD1599482.1 sulfurtransferase [Pseudomonas typographi]
MDLYLSVEALCGRLANVRHDLGRSEIAFLDVSEEGEFGQGHPLWAVNVPYSRLESVMAALVPNLRCPVVLIDHGHAVAERAARRLHTLGYADVRIVEGGVVAWEREGRELFKGVYVPSKAFGEWLEQRYGTPTLQPDELLARRARGDDLVILDPRTPAEHRVRHVPGARSCPGGELLDRFKDLVSSPDTLVVLACGGRTRGIVAAEALRQAEVENPIAALADGNHGWLLAGLELEYGALDDQPSPSAEALAYGRQRARSLAAKANIPTLDPDTVSQWLADPTRTTYVLDVRAPRQYEASHLARIRNAPGEQLLQATDRWIAVQGARVVLVDEHETSAVQIAYFLRALGWQTGVLAGGIAGAHAAGWRLESTRTSSRPINQVLTADAAAAVHLAVEHAVASAPEVTATQAAILIRDGASGWVFDTSADYLRRHPPGSQWANRAYLGEALARAARGEALVLFSSDGHSAHLAAIDLIEAAHRQGAQPNVQVVRGGIEAWAEAGLHLSPAEPGSLSRDQRVDFLYWAANRRNGDQQAMRNYLAWERQLPLQLQRDGSQFAEFVTHPPAYPIQGIDQP